MSYVEDQYQKAVEQRRELRKDRLKYLPEPYVCPSCDKKLLRVEDCLGIGHANLTLNEGQQK